MRLRIKQARIEIPPRSHDTVLITGDGRSLPFDLELFLGWGQPHEVIAIGRSINIYPGRVLHWANVDGADSAHWAENLPKKNNGQLPIRHTLGDCRAYDVDWDTVGEEIDWNQEDARWHGSTSLFAVHVALALGYPKIILAGCPMDSKGHWFFGPEHKGPNWYGQDYTAWLDFAQTEEAKRVKSMSGYTRQILRLPRE